MDELDRELPRLPDVVEGMPFQLRTQYPIRYSNEVVSRVHSIRESIADLIPE